MAPLWWDFGPKGVRLWHYFLLWSLMTPRSFRWDSNLNFISMKACLVQTMPYRLGDEVKNLVLPFYSFLSDFCTLYCLFINQSKVTSCVKGLQNQTVLKIMYFLHTHTRIYSLFPGYKLILVQGQMYRVDWEDCRKDLRYSMDNVPRRGIMWKENTNIE